MIKNDILKMFVRKKNRVAKRIVRALLVQSTRDKNMSKYDFFYKYYNIWYKQKKISLKQKIRRNKIFNIKRTRKHYWSEIIKTCFFIRMKIYEKVISFFVLKKNTKDYKQKTQAKSYT